MQITDICVGVGNILNFFFSEMESDWKILKSGMT